VSNSCGQITYQQQTCPLLKVYRAACAINEAEDFLQRDFKTWVEGQLGS